MGLGAQQRHAGVKAPAHQIDALARGFDVGCDGGKAFFSSYEGLQRVARADGVREALLQKPLFGQRGLARSLVDVHRLRVLRLEGVGSRLRHGDSKGCSQETPSCQVLSTRRGNDDS